MSNLSLSFADLFQKISETINHFEKQTGACVGEVLIQRFVELDKKKIKNKRIKMKTGGINFDYETRYVINEEERQRIEQRERMSRRRR